MPAREIERLVYYSTPRDGERTTMFSEITDLTNIEYASIDVCPGLKNTEILDLNFDALPERHRGRYDVVFNFGTTEHIVNQWNCFEVIHDAMSVGGVAYHQLPATGYLDHGYYCYTPLFFRELATANGYEIEQLAFTPAGENRIDALSIDVMAGDTLLKEKGHPGENNRIPQLNIHVVLRKTNDRPFRVSLEIATAHSEVNRKMLERYTGNDIMLARHRDTVSGTAEAQLAAMMASRSWRLTAPLRYGSAILSKVFKRLGR